MADKEFDKTYAIKIEKFKELIDPEYSTVLLSKFDKNTKQILKITKEPVMRCNKKKDSEEINRNVTFYVNFKYKDRKVPLFIRVGESAFFRFAQKNAKMTEIKEEAYSEMNPKHISGKVEKVLKYFKIDEWEKDKFLGKYAFFTKTATTMKIDGKMKEVYPQFINVIQKEGFEPTEFKSALDTLNEIDDEASQENTSGAPADPVDTSGQTAEFVENYKSSMQDYNAMAEKEGQKPKVISAKDCMAKYTKQFHPEEYAQVVENYRRLFAKK